MLGFKQQYELLQKDSGNYQKHVKNELLEKNDKQIFLFKNILIKEKWLFLAVPLIIISTYFYYAFFSLDPIIRSDLILPTEIVFLNRPKLIAAIDKAFKKQDGIRTVVIIGIGGAGKTTLARQYGRLKRHFLVWELNAETKEILFKCFKELAYALAETKVKKEELNFIQNIENAEEKEQQLLSFVKHNLKLKNKWLLIYDNVENFSEIRKYFPQDMELWGLGKVIITTRDSNIINMSYIKTDNIIHINKLSLMESSTLISKILYHCNLENLTYKKKEKILTFLNNIPPFPLDISTAAFYIRNTQITFDEYIERINKCSENFLKEQENFTKESSDYTKTRYGIVSLSLEKIIKLDARFQELLLYISLLDSQNIPRELLDNFKNSTLVDSFLYHLKKYSLIIEDPTSSKNTNRTLSIHRSTQAVSLLYLKKVMDLKRINQDLKSITNALSNYMKIIIEEENLSKIKLLINHAKVLLNHNNLLDQTSKANLAGELGCIYFLLNDYSKARQILDENLKTLNKDPSNQDKIARFVTYLGYTYRELNNYPEGKKLLEQAYETYKKMLSYNHADMARCLKYLGMLYGGLGDFNKAKDLLEQSLLIYEKYFPENHAAIAWVLTSLGCICRGICDYERSKELLNRSLLIYKKYFLGNNSGIAWALAHLGNTYHDQGDYRKAKKLLEECLITTKSYFPEDHTRVAWVLIHLAKIHKKLGNYVKSKELIEQSLKIYLKHFPKTHMRVAWVSMNLGCIFEKLGNYEKSRDIFDVSLKIYEKYYPEYHDDIGWSLSHLGNVHRKLRNYEKAKELLMRSLFLYQNYFPSHQVKIARILASLSNVFYSLENYEKAKKLLEECLTIYRKHYGNYHIETARIYRDLGQVYIQMNQLDYGERLILQSLSILKENNHPECHTCLENLAALYLKKSTQTIDFKKKYIYYLKQALQIVTVNFPRNSPHILRIKKKLGTFK